MTNNSILFEDLLDDDNEDDDRYGVMGLLAGGQEGGGMIETLEEIGCLWS